MKVSARVRVVANVPPTAAPAEHAPTHDLTPPFGNHIITRPNAGEQFPCPCCGAMIEAPPVARPHRAPPDPKALALHRIGPPAPELSPDAAAGDETLRYAAAEDPRLAPTDRLERSPEPPHRPRDGEP